MITSKDYSRSYLSVMASEAPKAQHDPQLPWSRISPMDGQFGQASRESKFSGRSSFLKDLVFSWFNKIEKWLKSSACHFKNRFQITNIFQPCLWFDGKGILTHYSSTKTHQMFGLILRTKIFTSSPVEVIGIVYLWNNFAKIRMNQVFDTGLDFEWFYYHMVNWVRGKDGRWLYTAPCGMRAKWPSKRRTPVQL